MPHAAITPIPPPATSTISHGGHCANSDTYPTEPLMIAAEDTVPASATIKPTAVASAGTPSPART